MTGIEQLRKLGADAVRGGEVGRAICDIADQIERERECERDTIENLRLELGEARDDAAWAREHGGLDRVKKLLDWVVGQCSTKQQLDFDFWLSGRVMHELGFDEDMADRDEVERRLLARLMPEGMEWLVEAWPRFEDDAPVKLGDMALIGGDADMVEAVQIWIHGKPVIYGDNGSQQLEKGERVKRPAPSVLAADGEPLEVGQTVWDTNGDELVIGAIEDGGHTVACRYVDVGDGIPTHGMWSPSDLTHHRPVLDENGVPISEGDTVWDTDAEADTPLTVVEVSSDLVRCEYTWKDGKTYRPCYPPDQLTHTKPEPPDSAERIADDIKRMAEEWCSYLTLSEASAKAASSVGEETMGVALGNLSKRCRALADRERGER